MSYMIEQGYFFNLLSAFFQLKKGNPSGVKKNH